MQDLKCSSCGFWVQEDHLTCNYCSVPLGDATLAANRKKVSLTQPTRDGLEGFWLKRLIHRWLFRSS